MRSWPVVLILVLISFYSCNRKDGGKYIPRKDLIPLLVDMHVADALAVNTSISDQFNGLDSSMVYSSVLKKHGYSKQELIRTMEYYTSNPEKLAKIYDDLFSAISKKSEEAKSVYEQYSYSNTENVWRSKLSRISTIGKYDMYPEPFEFQVDSAGTYILNVVVKRTVEDSSSNPRIVAYLFSPDNDVPGKRQYFEETKIPISKYPREYTLVQELIDTSLTHMRIIIPEYDNEDTVFYKRMEITNLRLRKLKTDRE